MQFTGEQLAKIGALCQQYGVRELALFGSRARGDNRPESDYDFLVDYLPSTRPGLIEFIGLEQDLSDLLRTKVDLVTRRGLRSQLQQSVLHDSLTVYAQRYGLDWEMP